MERESKRFSQCMQQELELRGDGDHMLEYKKLQVEWRKKGEKGEKGSILKKPFSQVKMQTIFP